MSIVSCIVIALSFGISDMLLMQRCAATATIRLTRALLIVNILAWIHTLFFGIGVALGDLLRFEGAAPDLYKQTNAFINLGIVLLVCVKALVPYLRKEPRLPLFDLSAWHQVLGMTVATSIDCLLVGIGAGVAYTGGVSYAYYAVPMLILCILLGYMGAMFGRRAVVLRPRRWAVVAALLLLGSAVAAVIAA